MQEVLSQSVWATVCECIAKGCPRLLVQIILCSQIGQGTNVPVAYKYSGAFLSCGIVEDCRAKNVEVVACFISGIMNARNLCKK